MIAKRIDRQSGDNYRALALYVAAAGHEEKALMSWATGCLDDDYLSGIHEVEATQALNNTSAKPKTYHLMVSFRPEDEDKLTPDVFKEVEQAFAEALGFANHQRHAGVHRDTDNLHLHMAYNQIDPERFKRHAPYYDFTKLSLTCRRLEQKYGLTIDRGMDPERTPEASKVNAKVKSIEAQTGQESLFSYILRHKPKLMAGLEAAATWHEAHTVFLKQGLQLKISGNGLAIKDRHGKHAAKASAIDRGFSKVKLEARFGLFEDPAADLFQTVKTDTKYTAAPLLVSPERDNLYQIFQTEMATRRSALETINQDGARRYEAARIKWEQKRRELECLPMLKHDRQRARLELKARERAELEALRTEVAAKRQTAREERPYTSWKKYLQHQATQGHETALAILRSKNEAVQPEATPTTPADHQIVSQSWADQRKEVLKQHGISDRHRRALLVVIKMRELLEKEADPGRAAQELKFRIDTKGTIIFTLPDGGTIRDSGQEIHFSAHNTQAMALALKLAESRWGKTMLSDESKNKFLLLQSRYKSKNIER